MQLGEAGKLAWLCSPVARHLMGRDAVIAVEVLHSGIFKSIASEFSKNSRSMATQFLGYCGDTDACSLPARDLATLIQLIHVDMRVGAFHVSFLASDKPLLSIASRTSSLNPPPTSNVAERLECPLCRKVEMSARAFSGTATSPDLSG
jgi:hypothetical protein